MHFAAVDWAILGAVYVAMVAGVVLLKPYMRSVVDFLAAGRTAGRYLLSVSQGVAALGAITVVGYLEQNFVAGFALTWWGFSQAIVILVLTVSGFVIYRFRQTRSLTLPEFFERRYSRRFRVFTGMLAFTAGLINFGIFPAVGARFFIHYIGLPDSVSALGFAIGTFPLIMLLLLGTSIFFVFSGGQVAVIITDFVQGVFVNLVFIVITVFLLVQVDWAQIFEALAMAPENASLINPYKTSQVADFNFWYFLIGTIGVVYVVMSWQGTQAYNASARSAHEAKMGQVLTNWRENPWKLFVLIVPVIAYTVLHHPDFAAQAGTVNELLARTDSETIRNQLRGPAVLVTMLPVGLLGAFAAVMLTAFVSTHDTYLHSWGSIFIQDVVMPFRKEPFTPEQHMRVLRGAVLGVAVFIFMFSLLFQQSQYIWLFFAITGAIFAGGSGAVLIGGLYWKRGTAAAAWSAMITGSSIAVGGIIIHQLVDDFPVNGQEFWGIAMAASTLVYILVSLLGPKRIFDLDRLLHRGRYALEGEMEIVDEEPSRGFRVLGMGREFTRSDRLLYVATYVWVGGWTLVFIVGTVINLTRDVGDEAWAGFWEFYVYLMVVVSGVVVLWFAIGGFMDIRAMLGRLAIMRRDDTDDGWVRTEGGPE
ncbi:MAG: sodium:solute symporter [marine benthic group bacterium]|jgi:SSS family solute:Na+ symporter|nr:sodium:solute symporter [Candidatus Benthicola marisminoris]